MSYLSALRLHFSGLFQASVATVNNDPKHYDTEHFKESYQKPGTAINLNGWWNPNGDGVFRLIDCKVRSAFDVYGQPVEKDPIIGALLGDSNRRVPAKMVDLDPQQQLGSHIYGLEVRLGAAGGVDWLRAQFEPAGFFDAWTRTTRGTNNETGSAAYQSVLTNLELLAPSGSPWLKELLLQAAQEAAREAAEQAAEKAGKKLDEKTVRAAGDKAAQEARARLEAGELSPASELVKAGRLSIKFNVDGFDVTPTSPSFCRGRIVGTIGVARAREPSHFIVGRHFIADTLPSSGYPLAANQLFNAVAIVDRDCGKIRLDLGNSLPVVRPGGGPIKSLKLALVYPILSAKGDPDTAQTGIIPSTPNTSTTDHYKNQAGVFDLPADKTRFTPAELDVIERRPLAIMLTASDKSSQIVLRETPDGLYVQADESAFRMSPGDPRTVAVHAMKFGKPYSGARVLALLDNTWLQGGANEPPVSTPPEALRFATKRKTDGNGRTVWRFWAGDPGRPRGYLDGQVYGVRFALAETMPLAMNYPFAQKQFSHFLVWSGYPNPPKTWYGGIKDIFTLYANLYPVMTRIVDMSDYDSVFKFRTIIAVAMQLPFEDANFMPVSRDLSPAKVRAVLEWLKNPEKGTPPPPCECPKDTAAAAEDLDDTSLHTGKSNAYARTFFVQTQQRER